MNHIKLFESFNDNDIIEIVDDISAYIPTETSRVDSQWILTNGNIKKIYDDNTFSKYFGKDKSKYVRYYIFGFHEMSYFFKVEDDIINRANSYDLKFIVLNSGKSEGNNCKLMFFKSEDFNRLEIDLFVKNFNEKGYDVLFEDDIKVNREEFDVTYEDDDIIAIRPKTYKSMIKYSSDTNWKLAFKKNQKWIDKYMSSGSYYGGVDWYKNKKVTQEIKNWYSKLLKLPTKKSETEIKEFVKDFPRYLLYIVIFKKAPVDDEMKKIFMLYNLSRGEYGELPHQFSSSYVIGGSYWGDMLDASHNQVKVENANGKRITFQDIHKRYGSLFSKAFRRIEEDFNEEKDKIYDLVGFWADKGGEYSKNPLVFVRNQDDELIVTKQSLITKTDKGIRFGKLGKYSDPNFDYWEIDDEDSKEKELPNRTTFKDYFQDISDNVKKLKGDLEKYGLNGSSAPVSSK